MLTFVALAAQQREQTEADHDGDSDVVRSPTNGLANRSTQQQPDRWTAPLEQREDQADPQALPPVKSYQPHGRADRERSQRQRNNERDQPHEAHGLALTPGPPSQCQVPGSARLAFLRRGDSAASQPAQLSQVVRVPALCVLQQRPDLRQRRDLAIVHLLAADRRPGGRTANSRSFASCQRARANRTRWNPWSSTGPGSFRLGLAVLPAVTFGRSAGRHAQSMQARHVVGLDPGRRRDGKHRRFQHGGPQQVCRLLITIDGNQPDVGGAWRRLDHGIGITGHGRHPDAPMAPRAVAPRTYQGVSVGQSIVVVA